MVVPFPDNLEFPGLQQRECSRRLAAAAGLFVQQPPPPPPVLFLLTRVLSTMTNNIGPRGGDAYRSLAVESGYVFVGTRQICPLGFIYQTVEGVSWVHLCRRRRDFVVMPHSIPNVWHTGDEISPG